MKLLAKLGFSPYPEKNSAIHNIPTPACKQDLQRLFGMINYLSNYIPNMSELTAPLRSLLNGDVSWAWFAEHDSALTKINTVLSSAPVLRFYDEMLTIVLGCERFNMYTHRAEVNSDHKPLKTIFKKPLFKVPPRLQRMRLRFQKYYIKVKYVPGKCPYIADTLSRAYNESSMPSDRDMHKDMEYFIHSVV